MMNASRLDENDAAKIKTVNHAETIRLFEDTDLGLPSRPCSNQILSADSVGVCSVIVFCSQRDLMFLKIRSEKLNKTNIMNIKIHKFDVNGENMVHRWLISGCISTNSSVELI